MGLLDRAKKSINDTINPNKTVQKSVKLVRESGAKVSLDKIERSGGVSLSKSAAAAGVSLTKQGLTGIRGKFVVVLDHSESMRGDYANGGVQKLTEKALAYGLQFASDERVTIIPFDTTPLATVEVTLENFQGVVDRSIWNRNFMGSTNLTDALRVVEGMAKNTDELIFCAVITDGNPNVRTSCTKVVCDLAGYPVFLKMLALRDVPYLDELDNLGNDVRLLDNVNAQSFHDIGSITDEAFADAMAEEWASWVDLATKAGVLIK
jgi:hypothetical protein